MAEQWTQEPPSRAGVYWFYGERDALGRVVEEPEMAKVDEDGWFTIMGSDQLFRPQEFALLYGWRCGPLMSPPVPEEVPHG